MKIVYNETYLFKWFVDAADLSLLLLENERTTCLVASPAHMRALPKINNISPVDAAINPTFTRNIVMVNRGIILG